MANEAELVEFGYVLGYFAGWKPEAATPVLRDPIVRGMTELLRFLNGLPKAHNVSEFEFVIGYAPLAPGLLPEDDEAAIRRWHNFKRAVGELISTGAPQIKVATLADLKEMLDALAEFISRRVRFVEAMGRADAHR
jgi:hypothetical protein